MKTITFTVSVEVDEQTRLFSPGMLQGAIRFAAQQAVAAATAGKIPRVTVEMDGGCRCAEDSAVSELRKRTALNPQKIQ